MWAASAEQNNWYGHSIIHLDEMTPVQCGQPRPNKQLVWSFNYTPGRNDTCSMWAASAG